MPTGLRTKRIGVQVRAERGRATGACYNAPVASAVETARAIVHTPGVVGGRARIDRTRISVWLLVEMTREGMSPAEIVAQYPESRLSVPDIDAALSYAETHSAEIERDIREQDEETLD